MIKFYAYEVFDPTGGYCLFIHKEPDTFDVQLRADIDQEYDHCRLGFVQAKSVQHAIERIADDEWSYEEYNKRIT